MNASPALNRLNTFLIGEDERRTSDSKSTTSFWKRLFKIKESPKADLSKKEAPQPSVISDLQPRSLEPIADTPSQPTFSQPRPSAEPDLSSPTPLVHLTCRGCQLDYRLGEDAIAASVEFVLGSEAAEDLGDGGQAGREDLVATLRNQYSDTIQAALDKARPSLEIIQVSLKRGEHRNWCCYACDVVNSYPSELCGDAENRAGLVLLEPFQADSTSESKLEVVEPPLPGTSDADSSHEDEGRTALHITASLGQKDALELLVAGGADVTVKDNYGRTPLHHAVLYGSKDVMELLLAYGADVNAGNNFGGTPLHSAASFGMKDVAEWLLAYGADVNAENNFGETPLHCAVEKGHEEVAELLRQHDRFEDQCCDEESPVLAAHTDSDASELLAFAR